MLIVSNTSNTTNTTNTANTEEATQPANTLYTYVEAFVDELQRAGVRHVVICPGSRSTPFALTFAAHTAIRVWMHVDERSAAFFGLGLAKRLQQPVALLCTSGTAAANFFPALVEANLTHVPLLVLTADRPHELRENGAPQSIDQNQLYGRHVKWFVDVALPESTNAALRYIRTLADRATALAQALPAGPVHLNFPFREPLTPELPADMPPEAQRDSFAWYGRPDNTPYIIVHETTLAAPSPATIAHLAEQIQTAKKGLIIVGPYVPVELNEPLLQLAHRTGYPILADPLSQLRCGSHDHSLILSSYDAFLRNTSFVNTMQPQLILRFGAMPTSKPVLLYMKHYASCPLVVIDGQQGWEEPTQLAAEIIHADPAALCRELLIEIEREHEHEGKRPIYHDLGWLEDWQRTDYRTQQAVREAMQTFKQPFEGRIFTELAALLPDDTMLYVGNSMPVRDLDTFFWSSERTIHIMGNRGANGIDGVVSSALGASAARVDRHAVLVIGDLSFFHDLNGLLAARLHHLHLTIVLVNNDGGGIFSFLPQAAYPEHFEQTFGTPTGLDFSAVVQMYGGTFRRVSSLDNFRESMSQVLSREGLQVIEVQTERESNVTMHRHLWQAVEQALARNE